MIDFDITAFGAKADGRTNDTRAIQSAVDACAGSGGGRVLCPPGVYRVGSLELKDHVELHLAAGATLLASDDPRDYRKRLDGDHWIAEEKLNCDQHLIYADSRCNVALTGRGLIDGRCEAFMIPHPTKPAKGLVVKDWRPGQLIHFNDCRDVLIRDVSIRNSPSWTIWLLECRRVRVEGIAIHNIRDSANTDGVDICCCRDVIVSNCFIDAGDDCVTLYGSNLVNPARKSVCENIVVSNCTMTTRCCGVRIGYASDSLIRNAVFSNLVMPDVAIGVDMIPNRFRLWTGIELEHGPRIENIRFQNLVINATRSAIHLWMHDHLRPPAGISNIAFSGVTARARAGCHICGTPSIPIRNIRVSDLDLTLTGEADGRFATGMPYPLSCWASGSPAPHGIFIRHGRDIQLRDAQIRWDQASGPWQNAVRAESVEILNLDGLAASPPPGNAAAAVSLSDIRGLTMSRCEAGVPTCDKVTWSQSEQQRTPPCR